MKKMLLVVSLLFTMITNAQVGIGTPTPAADAILDIVSTNKGVLFPRVSLTDLVTKLDPNAKQSRALIIYNTTDNTAVKPGYYYWTNDVDEGSVTTTSTGKWNRIITASDLESLSNIYNIANIAVKTGNKYNGETIYKGIYDAHILENSANVASASNASDFTAITLLPNESSDILSKILKITIINSEGNQLTSSVTDIIRENKTVKFRTGVGNMYNVLFPGLSGSQAVKLLIEFVGAPPSS